MSLGHLNTWPFFRQSCSLVTPRGLLLQGDENTARDIWGREGDFFLSCLGY